jgi:hypothetical protein
MGATAALRRGLDIASASGNARTESNIQVFLADMEVSHGHLKDALGLLESAITKYHDSGDTSSLAAASPSSPRASTAWASMRPR